MFSIFKRSNINEMREENAGDGLEWLGLEPIRFFKDSGVVTARLRGRPREYVGKRFSWGNAMFTIKSVEWGASKKLVALRVR